MAPVRVGIVGLSSKPGAWATVAHLPRLKSSPNFEIVALSNSSLASTTEAIKTLGLPETTKAYESPEAMAQDPDIDLFVVSTRVDTHYRIAKPAIQAGKNVYVEWPLGANATEAAELVSLARSKNVRTIVGLQARRSPSILKVKEIVDSGRLGRIHSVNISSVSSTWQNNAVSSRYSYMTEKKVGGNILTIFGGHLLDAAFFVVGELKPGSYSTLLGNFRPQVYILQDDGKLSKDTIPKDTPDQVMLQGRLDRSPAAAFTFHLRAGNAFKDTPGGTWKIYGDKAELDMAFTSHIAPASSIKINNFETGEVEVIKVDEGGSEWTDLAMPAQNIGRLYEAYAEGKGYADWEDALKRHELIEEFWAGGM